MNSFSHVFPMDPMLRGNRTKWSAQNLRCYLCGRVFIDCLPDKHPMRPTRDHVHPRSRYKGKVNNLLLAHYRCNTEKGARDPHPCEILFLEFTNEIMRWKAYERERAKSYDVLDVPVVGR